MAIEEERDDPVADVRAAITQIEKGGASSTAASPPPVESDDAPHSSSDDPEAALDAAADDRPRDDKGRFVAADKAPEPKPQPIKATTDAGTVPAAVPQSTAAKPPPGWSPEAKAEFLKLSPAVQQAVLKREEEVSSGFKQKSDELRRWQEIDGILAPRRQYFQQFGHQTDAQALNHLMQWNDALERNPAQAIAFLANHYRVDLARLAGGQPQPNLPPRQQPQQPSQDINTLVEERIGLQFARMEIDSFVNDPENVHAADLKPLMAQFLQNGQAQDLKSAYDMAIWATPNLREEKVAQIRQEAEGKRQQDAAKALEEIDKKKRASGASLKGAPHGRPQSAPSKASNGSFDDVHSDVRAAVEALR